MPFWKQGPVAIDIEWQSELEASLEAGRMPLLDLGSSHLIIDDLSMLTALRTFAAHRADVLAPVMIAGGTSSLWLAALIEMQPATGPRRPLAPTGIFAGADQASYLATLTTLTPARRLEAGRMSQAIPANMLPLFTPYTQARPTLPWDALPFAVTEEALTSTRSSGSQLTAVPATVRTEATTLDAWVSWVAIGLTLLLVLLALIP